MSAYSFHESQHPADQSRFMHMVIMRQFPRGAGEGKLQCATDLQVSGCALSADCSYDQNKNVMAKL